MAACPCWGDRGTALGPTQMEDTCVRQVTAAERPAAAPITTNSGGSGCFGPSLSCSAAAVLTDIVEPN